MRALMGLAVAWAAMVAAAPARAEDASWARYPGAAYAAHSDPSDRAFVREWEAAPPRGYPTLSPANLAPMRAAIRRYSEIASAGGWAPLPDVALQRGIAHAAVRLLRARLRLSGDLEDGSDSESSLGTWTAPPAKTDPVRTLRRARPGTEVNNKSDRRRR